MSAPCLLLVHGWGCDAAIWDGLRSALDEFDVLAVERGYLGACPAWPTVPAGAVAVGHSAGLLDLLADLPSGCAGVVAINGFTRFAEAVDFPAGTPRRVLDRMARRMAVDPDGTLRAFRDRCGLPPLPEPPRGPLFPPLPGRAARHDRLRDGLAGLATQDRRAEARGLRLLALAAAADPIATPAMTRACFAEADTRWHPGDSHVLPLADPSWCAGQLRRFAS